jgi:hypothetical protein
MIPDISVALLHEGMVDRAGNTVTTSLTLIDVHDFARSSRTFGIQNVFVVHPSVALRRLAGVLKNHWEEGFGASYNPNRKDALEIARLVAHLDDAIQEIEQRTGHYPIIVATSARDGNDRMSYTDFRELATVSQKPYLILFGTGWGMGPELLARAEIFLKPIFGPGEYNHLSVRSACAIILDRIMGK